MENYQRNERQRDKLAPCDQRWTLLSDTKLSCRALKLPRNHRTTARTEGTHQVSQTLPEHQQAFRKTLQSPSRTQRSPTRATKTEAMLEGSADHNKPYKHISAGSLKSGLAAGGLTPRTASGADRTNPRSSRTPGTKKASKPAQNLRTEQTLLKELHAHSWHVLVFLELHHVLTEPTGVSLNPPRNNNRNALRYMWSLASSTKTTS